jgi:hypothetical protein
MVSNTSEFSLLKKLEAAPRFELGVELLQSSALPLGYAASLKNDLSLLEGLTDFYNKPFP